MEEVKVLPMASYAVLLLWAVAGPLLAWRIVLVRERRARWFETVGCSLLSDMSHFLYWGQLTEYREMFGTPLDCYVFRSRGMEARLYRDQWVIIERNGEEVHSGWLVEFTAHFGAAEFVLANVPLDDLEPQEVARLERHQASFGRIDWCGYRNGVTGEVVPMKDNRSNKARMQI